VQLLIPGIVVLALILIIYLRVKKQQKLLSDAERYEAFLRDSRLTRWQYLQCMEKSKEILADFERISDNVNALKAELLGIRSELRDELRFLRAEIKQSAGTELDKRTIAQLKTDFQGKWKHLSSRKTNYNENLDILLETKKKMEQANQAETAASNKWSSEKERVMNLWRELNSKIQITDPHKYFG